MSDPKTRDEKSWPSDEIRTPESGAQAPTELLDFAIEGKFYKAVSAAAASEMHREEKAFEPDWASPPGDTIRDWMEETSTPLDALAIQLNMRYSDTRRIILGERCISPNEADALGKVIGPNMEFWVRREDQYRKALRRQDCCYVWPELAASFSWFTATIDGEKIKMMPCIVVDGYFWRVDYCPSCGKPARDREMVR